MYFQGQMYFPVRFTPSVKRTVPDILPQSNVQRFAYWGASFLFKFSSKNMSSISCLLSNSASNWNPQYFPHRNKEVIGVSGQKKFLQSQAVIGEIGGNEGENDSANDALD